MTTGISIGSRWGVKLKNPVSGITPVDPLTVPGVIRVMYYRSPYPKTLDSYLGPTATPGDTVLYVADQQASLGSPPFDDQSVPVNGATMRADGLEFSTDINDKLTLTNTPVNAGLTAFTMYLWGTQFSEGEGTGWVPLGNTNDQTLLFVTATQAIILDDGGIEIDGQTGIPDGKLLLRFATDGAGNYEIDATGVTSAAGNNPALGTFTYNCVGQAPNQAVPNGDTDNRHLGQIIVPFNTLGGAQDLGLRQTIINLDGVAYSL